MKSSGAYAGALMLGLCGVSIAEPTAVVWQGSAGDLPSIHVLDLHVGLVATVPGPGDTGGMTRVGNEVWWGSIENNEILRLDFSGNILGTIPAFSSDPTGGMTTVGDEVWWGSAQNGGVIRLDYSGNVLGTLNDIGLGSATGGLATVGDEVWWAAYEPGSNHPRIYVMDYSANVIHSNIPAIAIIDTGGFAVAEIDLPDADEDGVLDTRDNCLAIVNPEQRDTDGDQIGNWCDADVHFPNDCMVNFPDLSVYQANFFVDGDLDTDNNGDGRTLPT